MLKALVTARRSKDPSTQVGAELVDKNNIPIGSGYNGFPRDIPSDALPWDREGDPLYTKYMYMCHAESNAIDNSDCGRERLEHSKLYSTLFPCNECAKRIIQNGIKEVIYLSDKYHDKDAFVAARKMFELSGVYTRQLVYSTPKIITIELKNE
jgi:dCMP deaminase